MAGLAYGRSSSHLHDASAPHCATQTRKCAAQNEVCRPQSATCCMHRSTHSSNRPQGSCTSSPGSRSCSPRLEGLRLVPASRTAGTSHHGGSAATKANGGNVPGRAGPQPRLAERSGLATHDNPHTSPFTRGSPAPQSLLRLFKSAPPQLKTRLCGQQRRTKLEQSLHPQPARATSRTCG